MVYNEGRQAAKNNLNTKKKYWLYTCGVLIANRNGRCAEKIYCKSPASCQSNRDEKRYIRAQDTQLDLLMTKTDILVSLTDATSRLGFLVKLSTLFQL